MAHVAAPVKRACQLGQSINDLLLTILYKVFLFQSPCQDKKQLL